VPGVGLDGVGVPSDGKHYDGVGWHRPGSSRSSSGCQLLISSGHLHAVGVDEGEEENVAGLLLPGEQLRFPVSIRLKSCFCVISQEHIETQDLARPGGVAGGALCYLRHYRRCLRLCLDW